MLFGAQVVFFAVFLAGATQGYDWAMLDWSRSATIVWWTGWLAATSLGFLHWLVIGSRTAEER